MIELDSPTPVLIGYLEYNNDARKYLPCFDKPKEGWLYGYGEESDSDGQTIVGLVELTDGTHDTFAVGIIKHVFPIGDHPKLVTEESLDGTSKD